MMDDGWVFERRLIGLVLAAFVLRACIVPWPGDEASADQSAEPGTRLCDSGEIIDRLPSPDGAWEAVAYARSCRFGPLSGQTTTKIGVRLVSTRGPSRVGTVFERLGGESGYDRPFLAWTAPSVLDVVVERPPSEVETLDFDGVHVDLRVDPDDPEIVAAKADWERMYNEALVRLRKEMALRKERGHRRAARDRLGAAPGPGCPRCGMTGRVRRWRLLARRLARVLVVALVAAFLPAWGWLEVAFHEVERACKDRPVVARLPSPDGAWDAVVDEAVCPFVPWAEWGTRTTTAVRLVSARDPSLAGQLLYIGSPGRRDYARPLLAWAAPGVLRVTLGESPHVGTLRFAGVRGDSRVDPDGPAIRAEVVELRRGYDGLAGEAGRTDGGALTCDAGHDPPGGTSGVSSVGCGRCACCWLRRFSGSRSRQRSGAIEKEEPARTRRSSLVRPRPMARGMPRSSKRFATSRRRPE